MKIDYELCIDCMACLEVKDECPVDALSKKDNKVILDSNKCTNCGLCNNICPVEAIV